MFLAHYNDGKEKWQSHEVSLSGLLDTGEAFIDLSTIEGYGSSKEEAYQDFRKKFNEMYAKMTELVHTLAEYEMNGKSDKLEEHETDCIGNIIDQQNQDLLVDILLCLKDKIQFINV